jgi:hypothetical protein
MTFEVTHIAAVLLDPQAPPPPGLRSWNGADPRPRFEVHRRNAVASLVAALADTLPVLQRLLGEPAFAAMARGFLATHPPASPVLTDWGDALPGWLELAEDAQAQPWLADLARLELARVRAFHAADAPPLPPARLQQALAEPDTLAQARLVLHPSCRLLVSAHAVVSLWQACRSPAGDPAAVDLARREALLVLRDPDDAVVVLPLPMAEAGFVGALMQGLPLIDAVATAPGLALGPVLARLVQHGALVGWRVETP